MTAPRPQPAAHAIMFWFLAAMAFALFAPAVLLPLWEESLEIHAYELRMAKTVAELEARRDRNGARIEALKADPLVIERIARRELNYKPEGEQSTRWTPEELAAMRVRVSPLAEPVVPVAEIKPSWVIRVQSWLPAWPYHKLFVQMPNRLLMLLMAGGLLVTAFVLYGPKNGRPAENSTPASPGAGSPH